jgi:hypothetical protein
MSIYGSHRNRSLRGDLASERVRQVGNDLQPDPPTRREMNPTTVNDAALLRKASPYNRVLPASRVWFDGLPRAVQPTMLIVQYPRIVNLLAQQWNDVAACSAYLDELLASSRPGRRGFPADVRQDILVLREYFIRSRRSARGASAIEN